MQVISSQNDREWLQRHTELSGFAHNMKNKKGRVQLHDKAHINLNNLRTTLQKLSQENKNRQLVKNIIKHYNISMPPKSPKSVHAQNTSSGNSNLGNSATSNPKQLTIYQRLTQVKQNDRSSRGEAQLACRRWFTLICVFVLCLLLGVLIDFTGSTHVEIVKLNALRKAQNKMNLKIAKIMQKPILMGESWIAPTQKHYTMGEDVFKHQLKHQVKKLLHFTVSKKVFKRTRHKYAYIPTITDALASLFYVLSNEENASKKRFEKQQPVVSTSNIMPLCTEIKYGSHQVKDQCMKVQKIAERNLDVLEVFYNQASDLVVQSGFNYIIDDFELQQILDLMYKILPKNIDSVNKIPSMKKFAMKKFQQWLQRYMGFFANYNHINPISYYQEPTKLIIKPITQRLDLLKEGLAQRLAKKNNQETLRTANGNSICKSTQRSKSQKQISDSDYLNHYSKLWNQQKSIINDFNKKTLTQQQKLISQFFTAYDDFIKKVEPKDVPCTINFDILDQDFFLPYFHNQTILKSLPQQTQNKIKYYFQKRLNGSTNSTSKQIKQLSNAKR